MKGLSLRREREKEGRSCKAEGSRARKPTWGLGNEEDGEPGHHGGCDREDISKGPAHFSFPRRRSSLPSS